MTDKIPPLAMWLKASSAERKAANASADYNIPTLNTRASPDEPAAPDVPFDPVLIGTDFGGLNVGAAPTDSPLSAEDIKYISEKLRNVLLPEIDKIVSYAMNHAFAYAMDQAQHMLREKVHAKIKEMIPKLVEDAIRNPPKNS